MTQNLNTNKQLSDAQTDKSNLVRFLGRYYPKAEVRQIRRVLISILFIIIQIALIAAIQTGYLDELISRML